MKIFGINLLRALFVVLIVILIANLSFPKREDQILGNDNLDTSRKDLVQFSIVGDTPYDTLGSTALLEKFQSHIDDNNDRSYADFLIHVGDIKKGITPCDLSYYTNTLKVLESSTKPPYLLIGDNEWNDCRRGTDPSMGLAYWQRTFTNMNQEFITDFDAKSQIGRPENISFYRNSVLFVTINQVGGRIHDSTEWRQRLADNLAWVQESMTKYRGQANAYVLFAHAAPGTQRENEVIGDDLFYLPFRDFIQTFSEPILYIQGDMHVWNYDTSYFDEQQPDNFLRVIIDEDQHTQSVLQVVVSTDSNEPFYFDRNMILDSLTVGPSLKNLDDSTVSISWQTNNPTVGVVRYGKKNDPLKYRLEDPINKTRHEVTITNLDGVSKYEFEVGTRTSRLSDRLTIEN